MRRLALLLREALLMMRGALFVSGLFLLGACGIGCAGEDDGAADDSQNLTGSGSPKIFDKDIPIPPQSLPLKKTFKETLTRFGVTVTPSITPSGTFGLKDADIHVQAQYTANPPHVDKIDIFSRGTWTADFRVDVDVLASAEWKTQPVDMRKQFTFGTSLGGKAFELAKVPLAVLPLPSAPNIQLQIDLELAAACSLEFDAELHAFAEVGLEGLATSDVFYLSSAPKGKKVGFVPNGGLTKEDMFHISTPPHVSFKDGNVAQLHGKCGIQPSLNATAALGADPTHPLADVGVKFVVQPYASFDGVFKSMDDWSVDAKAGIEGTVAPFGDFFGQPFSTSLDLKLFDFELAKGPTTSSTTLSGPSILPSASTSH
jgi:hypothetical protein